MTTLTLRHIVRTESHVRSNDDHRRFVTRVTAAYFDTEGHEYRKTFESTNGTVSVPPSGTHTELNAARSAPVTS